jgi:hypothetical protein
VKGYLDGLYRVWHWPAPVLLLAVCLVVLCRLIWSFGVLGEVAVWAVGLLGVLLADGPAAGGAGAALALPQPLLPLGHRQRVVLLAGVAVPVVALLWLGAHVLVPQPVDTAASATTALLWLPGSAVAFASARLAPHHLARLWPWGQLLLALTLPRLGGPWLALLPPLLWLALGRGPWLAPLATRWRLPARSAAVWPVVRPRSLPQLAGWWTALLLGMTAAGVALQTAAQILVLRGATSGAEVAALRLATLALVLPPLWLGRDSLGCLLPPLRRGTEPGLLLPVHHATWWRCTAAVTFACALLLTCVAWWPLHVALAQAWFRDQLPAMAVLPPLWLAAGLAAGLQALRRGWRWADVAVAWLSGTVLLVLWQLAVAPQPVEGQLAGLLGGSMAVLAGGYLAGRLLQRD